MPQDFVWPRRLQGGPGTRFFQGKINASVWCILRAKLRGLNRYVIDVINNVNINGKLKKIKCNNKLWLCYLVVSGYKQKHIGYNQCQSFALYLVSIKICSQTITERQHKHIRILSGLTGPHSGYYWKQKFHFVRMNTFALNF